MNIEIGLRQKRPVPMLQVAFGVWKSRLSLLKYTNLTKSFNHNIWTQYRKMNSQATKNEMLGEFHECRRSSQNLGWETESSSDTHYIIPLEPGLRLVGKMNGHVLCSYLKKCTITLNIQKSEANSIKEQLDPWDLILVQHDDHQDSSLGATS